MMTTRGCRHSPRLKDVKATTAPSSSSISGGGRGRIKKAKTAFMTTTMTPSSSSSTSAQAPLSRATPKPTQVIFLDSVPDLGHDAIASYLTNKDMHRLMEAGQWLVEVYGGRIKDIHLGCITRKKDGSGILSSLLGRRPSLLHLNLNGGSTLALAEALEKGRCAKLQVLEIGREGDNGFKASLPRLLQVLGDGACPRLHRLILPLHFYWSHTYLMIDLGKTLRSRMEKGHCCGLKVLEFGSRSEWGGLHDIKDLTPVLSSGAYDQVEEIQLYNCSLRQWFNGDNNNNGLAEWITRTTASHLRVLSLFSMSGRVATALCAPGVAPRLEQLRVGRFRDPVAINCLSEAIGNRKWPGLRKLSLPLTQMADTVVQAIHKGVPDLTSLSVGDESGGDVGLIAMARALQDGACPGLEELIIDGGASTVSHAIAELGRAFEAGAPCSLTLRRLDFSNYDMTMKRRKELWDFLSRGACPNLEYLTLKRPRFEWWGQQMEDMSHLAQALEAGALTHLQELNLNGMRMGAGGGAVVVQALAANHLPNLKKLHLSACKITGDALEGLACPQLVSS